MKTLKKDALARASLTVLAFVTAAEAHAQTQTKDPASDRSITVIGLRTIAPDRPGKRPGGADLIGAEEFDDKHAVSLRDALAFSPGVYTQPRFGQEIRISIRGSGISRGFHMRGLTLLQDGVPINLADDNGDFQELDPLVLDAIEIYRGATALRFGGSTLGGAINGVTPTGRSSEGLDLRLEGGSFDTLRGKAAYGIEGGRLDGWAAITADRSDGDRAHSRRDSLRLNGNVGIRLGEGAETRFYASAQTIDQRLPGALDLRTAKSAPRTGNFNGDQARNVDSLRLQNRTSIGFGAAELEAGAFLNLKHLAHPIFQFVEQHSRDSGLFARLLFDQGPLTAVLGATARFGTVDARRFVNLQGKRGALTFEADQEARTIDVYSEARYRLGALSLIAGGVFTHGVRKQEQAIPITVSASADFRQFSPRLALLWEPRWDLQFYANYARSHEMPGFIELAQIAQFVPLDAQKAWTSEIGGRGRIGIAAFDVSFYRTRLKGELLQFSVGPDIPASTFNAERTLHQGVEVGLDLQLAPWARLRQVYLLSDFRFRDDRHYGDNRLPVVPKHLYRAEIRIGSERLNIAPSFEWAPKGAWADYRNSLRVDGYALLGFTAEAELKDGLSVFLDARNLAGTRAVGDISAVIAATPASVIFHPVERRAVYGGVRAHF